MASKKRSIRRRRPIQDRSVATVEALLEATAQVLIERGYEHGSTNEIARRAGVSIGSLYQYFKDKDALVLELARRHYARLESVLAEALPGFSRGSLRARIEQVLRSLIAVQRVNPRLTQVLQQQIPRVGQFGLIDEFESRVEAAIARELAAVSTVDAMDAMDNVREHLRPRDPVLAAQIVVRAVSGVIQSTLRRSPSEGVTPELERELIALVLRYLLGDPG